MSQTEVRKVLANIQFRGDSVYKQINKLSGGEKTRIQLMLLMLSNANFLLLDEPSNHLDIISREALEIILNNFKGTLFIISHDRYLINKLADHILYLNEGGLQEVKGNYNTFLQTIK
ncbi:ATP-binding cassette domain-containing protein [Anaerocolumna chitinilytica]|uniref:ABC transporter domain-containing protein n=1 Tax=Anaerocolumna chitinilytica TaxID=1727145 RepID=A0A7M3SA60_9FIRM|nr:ATP-binding cassette domain-containing protein [Anaerocolumna chitinilytica]BCK01478.1 hypothetical protein bsdcttw_45180 [Anaerocolumna chitinilytica]